MGTLGCINDMLQRDKENRALRKLSRGRMREHYKYLVERKGPERADVTIEEIEKIRRNTTEKELSDKEHLFRAKTILAACALVLLLLGVLCYKFVLISRSETNWQEIYPVKFISHWLAIESRFPCFIKIRILFIFEAENQQLDFPKPIN